VAVHPTPFSPCFSAYGFTPTLLAFRTLVAGPKPNLRMTTASRSSFRIFYRSCGHPFVAFRAEHGAPRRLNLRTINSVPFVHFSLHYNDQYKHSAQLPSCSKANRTSRLSLPAPVSPKKNLVRLPPPSPDSAGFPFGTPQLMGRLLTALPKKLGAPPPPQPKLPLVRERWTGRFNVDSTSLHMPSTSFLSSLPRSPQLGPRSASSAPEGQIGRLRRGFHLPAT
jgi:hypothetical protein